MLLFQEFTKLINEIDGTIRTVESVYLCDSEICF